MSRLTTRVKHIHLSSLISGIRADVNDVRLASIDCQTAEGTVVHNGFNHIIFATQANRAVPLLESYLSSLPAESPLRVPIEAQIQCLRAFRYRGTIVVNHTDDTLMPDSMEDRRDLNLVCRDRSFEGNFSKVADGGKISPLCISATHTMATHMLPHPAGYPAHLPQMYQTTNPIVAPCEDSIVSVAELERAVLTPEAKECLEGLYEEKERRWWQCRVESEAKLGRLQGGGREGPGVWICGSFAYGGIPLLEGCVVSARTVVEQGVLMSEGVALRGSPW